MIFFQKLFIQDVFGSVGELNRGVSDQQLKVFF